MATEIIGKCFICKKEITRHDVSFVEEGHEHPSARYYEKWPGDGVLCTEHPGVTKQWEKAVHFFDESIMIRKELGMPYRLADGYYEFGLLYKEKGDKANAKNCFDKAREISQDIGATDLLDRADIELKNIK